MRQNYSPAPFLSMILVASIVGVITCQSYLQNKEKSAEKEVEVEDSLNITYSLSDEGYITEVIIKEGKDTTIISSKDYTITFTHSKNVEYDYDLDTKGKTLKIHSSKYPSDKYK